MGTVAVKERGVASAFFFAQDVDFGFEFGVGMDAAGFCQYLAAFDFVSLNAAEQKADVVACFGLVELFSEHFDAGDDDGSFFGG